MFGNLSGSTLGGGSHGAKSQGLFGGLLGGSSSASTGQGSSSTANASLPPTSNALQGLFPSGSTGQDKPSTSLGLFGGAGNKGTPAGGTSSTLFGGSLLGAGASSGNSLFSGGSTAAGAGPASTSSSSFLKPGATNALGATTSPEGAKAFLPGRPSLHDILTVAPEWRPAFESILRELNARDTHVAQLRDTLRDLRGRNESQRVSLIDKAERARVDGLTQSRLLAEIESYQPAVRRLRRQVNAFSACCQRLLHVEATSTATTPQLLVVPQSDYIRFIDDLQQRLRSTEVAAEALERSVARLRHRVFESNVNDDEAELRTVLNVLMSQYKLLKYRQLGLHEKLRTAIDRFKYNCLSGGGSGAPSEAAQRLLQVFQSKGTTPLVTSDIEQELEEYLAMSADEDEECVVGVAGSGHTLRASKGAGWTGARSQGDEGKKLTEQLNSFSGKVF